MKAQIRAAIVEDEPASRYRLRALLAGCRDVTIVSESATGPEAVEALKQLRPSVVFLDVQMPGLDGFQVLRGLAPAPLPVVVFVTAYDRYAVRAFEFHAVDYLLKPFDDERFERTMAAVRSHLRTTLAIVSLQERLGRLLNARRDLAPGGLPAARIAIPAERGLMFVSSSSVTHVTSEGPYVRVHTVERSHLVRETLTSLAGRLPADRFLRIHRSTVVNLDAVQSLERLPHGDARLWLATGDSVRVSRAYRDAAMAALRLRARVVAGA